MRRSKKLLVDLLAAIAAGGVAYYVARPDGSTTNAETTRHDITAITAPTRARIRSSRSPDTSHTRALSVANAGPRVHEQPSMAILRNQLIVASSAYMHRRGEDVMRCLADVQRAGPEKLQFAVDVDSSAHQATTGKWRFVEIVDGEPLHPLRRAPLGYWVMNISSRHQTDSSFRATAASYSSSTRSPRPSPILVPATSVAPPCTNSERPRSVDDLIVCPGAAPARLR